MPILFLRINVALRKRCFILINSLPNIADVVLAVAYDPQTFARVAHLATLGVSKAFSP